MTEPSVSHPYCYINEEHEEEPTLSLGEILRRLSQEIEVSNGCITRAVDLLREATRDE